MGKTRKPRRSISIDDLDWGNLGELAHDARMSKSELIVRIARLSKKDKEILLAILKPGSN